MTKSKKQDEASQQLSELMLDLQRTRADFENYRKRVDAEKTAARESGATKTVLQLLPVIDTIDRAVANIPADIKEHQWVQGVAGLIKQLDKAMADMGVVRVEADEGTLFNPEYHQAIQVDDAAGEHEVVAEELQPGYLLNGSVIRPALVRVTRR